MTVAKVIQLLTLLCIMYLVDNAPTHEEYLKRRESIVDAEKSSHTGYMIQLTPDEEKVNRYLMQMKWKEYDIGRSFKGIFPPRMHFFHAKKYIDESPVFQLIRKMPKGAALHLHDIGVASVEFVIKEATYDPNCYMCHDDEGYLKFHFFEQPPTITDCAQDRFGAQENADPNCYDEEKSLNLHNYEHHAKNTDCDWKQVDLLRNLSSDSNAFDHELFKNLSLVVDNPEETYRNVDDVWEKFIQRLRSGISLVRYGPMFKKYYHQVLTEFYEDNVQYVELRAAFPPVYELDGSTHDKIWSVGAYESVTKRFMLDHPSFVGAKIIYTSIRTSDPNDIANDIKDALSLKREFPSFVAGYDICSQEDHGHPLIYYLEPLLYPAQHGLDLKYFFHAGETGWKDVSSDLNVLDALLLNTSRIGHGYAITKHPQAMKLARERDVPMEVNPISNQVLKLVDNLQNHPATELMSSGFPLVISSDNPTFWNAKGLSYDFYEAFMALGGAWADLSTLKQLAMDSIKYSAMDDEEKRRAFTVWENKWTSFIKLIILENNL